MIDPQDDYGQRRAQGHMNILQGEFGESWIRSVAAGSGLLHGHPFTLDLWWTDVLLGLPAYTPEDPEQTVRVQVKTTTGFSPRDDGTVSYELAIRDYNALRVRRNIRRVLAVVWLSTEGSRIRLEADGTLMVGHAAWMSLEDLPESSNATSVSVGIPLANKVDEPGLRRMLGEFGVPRSTDVPDVKVWEA